MIYIFELQTIASLAQAFSESTLIREREVVGKERRWDYIFCQFKAPVDVSFPLENNDLITSIFKGDALLNQLCEKQFSTDLKVEADYVGWGILKVREKLK